MPIFSVSTRILEFGGAFAKNNRCLVCGVNVSLPKTPTEAILPAAAAIEELGPFINSAPGQQV